MSNYYSRLIAVAAVLVCSISGFSQPWTQTNGPAGGLVIDIIECEGVILAGSLGGIYRTTDNGESWSHAMNGIPADYNITYFTQTPNYIYAAGTSEGLYRSSNGGLSWTPVPINLPSIFILELYAIGEAVYIGCEGAGVIRSVDGGEFEFVNSGFPASAFVVAFARAGDYIFCGLSGNGGSVGVYRSPIDIINWTQMNAGLIPSPSVLDLAVDGTDLYVMTQSFFEAGFFKSSDFGSNWFEPLADFDDFGGALLSYEGILYTTPDAGLPRKSIDGGESWTVSGAGLKPLSAFSYLGTPSGIFVGCERGVMRSTDGAANWQVKSKGITNVTTTSLFSDGDRLYATCRTSNLGRSDGVFYTDDDGENWIPMNDGLQPNPEVNAIVRSGSNIIVGTSSTGLYRKPDAGNAFLQVADVVTYAQINALLSVGQVVLAGASGLGELYRSTDNGVTWAQSNTGFNLDQEDQVYSLYHQNGVIFAGAFNALYKSTDFGATWTNSYSGIYPGANINAITSIGTDLYAWTYGNGLYKSSNNGASWLTVNIDVPVTAPSYSIASYNGILYAGSTSGVIKSSDNGASWTAINDNFLISRNALALAIHHNKLFVAMDENSVWKQDGALSINYYSSTGSDNIKIAPNPSNGILNVSVNEYTGAAEITIYNTIGQQIYNGLFAASQNNALVDISSQPSGVYLMIVKAGGRSMTKRLAIY